MAEFAFQREEDGTLSDEAAIFQALGAASVCWTHPEGAGVFDASRAEEIGRTLARKVAAGKPRLGLATTRELLRELVARTEVDGTAEYRTVDGDRVHARS